MTTPPVRRPRGRPRKDAAHGATTEQILLTAAALFAERGVVEVTIADVAQRCGVDRGAVYYHFGDKVALLQAFGDMVFMPLFDAIEESRSAPSPDLAVAAYLLREHRHLHPHRRAVAVLYGSPLLDGEAHAGYWQHLTRLDQAVADLLRDARAAGLLGFDDLDDAVAFINSLALGALQTAVGTGVDAQIALALSALGAASASELVARARALVDADG